MTVEKNEEVENEEVLEENNELPSDKEENTEDSGNSEDNNSDESDGTSESEGKSEEDEGEEELTVDEISEQLGVDISDMDTYYQENGEITEDHFERLEKAGISRSVVEQHIEGQKLLQEQYNNKAAEAVGGMEAFTEIAAWAVENLDEGYISEIDEGLSSPNKAIREASLMSLKSQYDASNGTKGKQGQLIKGTSTRAGTSRYENNEQLRADMNDPRYDSDEAFRRKVMNKVSRSSL